MQYVFTIIFALLLVTAQSCWKLSVDGHAGVFAAHSVTFGKVMGFVFAPLTLAGVLLYVVATALYMFLLSRYQFSFVQAMAIPLSLLFSISVAALFFGDRLTLVNFIGAAIIIVGIVLFTLR